MKRIMSALVTIGVIAAAAGAGAVSHAWAKDHFQGDILQSTAAVFNITDRNIADGKANIDLLKAINELEKSLKDIKSKAVEKQLKRLKRLWEEDHKRLKRAIDTRHQMIAKMSKRQTVTIR